MAEDEHEQAASGAEDTGEPTIAQRTRSHLTLEDFVLSDNLNFPDVEPNLYQSADSEVDTEYKKFLNQCYSTELGSTDTNTDDNDPEYVYNDDILCPGWSFKLDEVSEFRQYYTTLENAVPSCSVDFFEGPSTCVQKRRIDLFDDPEFARILNQQLRQHIQLLTQTYLLTSNTTNMRNEAEEARGHLDSYLKIFKQKTKPSNLLPALNLVNNLEQPKETQSSIRLSWRPIPIPDRVKRIIQDNPKVFLYPSLLPQVSFSFLPEKLIPKKRKIYFTTNEDKLLAFALNQFKGEPSQYAFIASLLMTAKTKTQISNHIKNIKRSSGCEDNPIKLYYANGQLPEIELDGDSSLDRDQEPEAICDIIDEKPSKIEEEEVIETQEKKTISEIICCDQIGADDIMNMNLDDLMAASTTISKQPPIANNINISSREIAKNVKNLETVKLKQSTLNLMAHKFSLSPEQGELLIERFITMAKQRLNERNYLHLLQLLSDLKRLGDKTAASTYEEIVKFLKKVGAPCELQDLLVLFLDLNQAGECGCSMNYLHWMRFFEFMRHLELYHEGDEGFEKKLKRLIDALQKSDTHRVKLAVANLVNKHPLLERDFELLDLDKKPHPSLFICEEDFEDITEQISGEQPVAYNFEHLIADVSPQERSYASQSCPCRCHHESITGRHCSKCNLKFIKGRMYLVNKIKPILAEWSYTGRVETPIKKVTEKTPPSTWTFEEDKEILEFCRAKAEQNEETLSFDAVTFEELVDSRGHGCGENSSKRSARQIAERFNELMQLYQDEGSNAAQ